MHKVEFLKVLIDLEIENMTLTLNKNGNIFINAYLDFRYLVVW
jgi:hypothetical protein